MGQGRKKLPTQIKKIQGTLQKCRTVENEMTVDLVNDLPKAPSLLSTIGRQEWIKVTKQLYNLNMLHEIDLRLIEAYCNEISIYIEAETELRLNGRVDNFTNTCLLYTSDAADE